MMRPRRTSRIHPLRRTLQVEVLEDRSLLSGVVQAVLNPGGRLEITGDAADNQFTIAPSPVAGMIRIAGDPGTSTAVNGAAFADFALSLVTDIQITLLEGLDKATLSNFSIAGDLTITYGNLDDVLATPNFNARSINLLLAGPGGVVGSGSNSGLLPPVGVGGSGSNGSLLPPVEGGGSGLLPP